MKSVPTNRRSCAARTRCRAFTLAEVLAALLFMAIVIPVAIQALRVASLAGQVAERKAVAARIADRVLNESLATGQWVRSSQGGSLFEGPHEYRWELDNEPWELGVLRQLTVAVHYTVQGQEYEVLLSTLADSSATTTTTTNTTSTSTGGGSP